MCQALPQQLHMHFLSWFFTAAHRGRGYVTHMLPHASNLGEHAYWN